MSIEQDKIKARFEKLEKDVTNVTEQIKDLDKKILNLKNLNIVDLDHNELEFLQLKGLLDEELIKPLYLS